MANSANPARPAPGRRLCALAELENPGSRGFRWRSDTAMFGGFIVRRGDQVVGFVDRCPHAGWPMGFLDGRYLTRDGAHILCAGHGALFEFDGVCVAGPCYRQILEPWPVEVRDGEVFTA